MRRAALLLLPALLAGCAALQTSTPRDNTAVADLKDASGRAVGTANFSQVGNTVRIVLTAKGLPPGEKGVHVHEVGKCDPPEFTSAGGHFNPAKREHGALNPRGHHAGDLPNIRIAADGSGRLESASDQMTLLAGETSIFDADGAAIVIHAQPDDFRTDPTGNSGARVACGAIVKAPARK